MRNRKKDLILDFTSLLDIVLLLLFFFILFSKIGADVSIKNAQEDAQKSKNKYDTLAEDTEKLQKQLEHNLQIVDQVTSQEANEIIHYNSGNNLKILLLGTGNASDPLKLKVVLNQKVIGECIVTDQDDDQSHQLNDIRADKLIKWLEAERITEDSVVLCDFVYDGDVPRTSEAYDKVTGILETIQAQYGYTHLYFSPTDLSIGSRINNGD